MSSSRHIPTRELADMLNDVWLRGLSEHFMQIARRHDALLTEVLGCGRHKGISAARQECWHLLRQRGWSYPRIAELFDRDHTTVMRGVKAHMRREFSRAMKEAPSLARVEHQDVRRSA